MNASFSDFMRFVFDESGFFTRTQWAGFLGVSEFDLRCWVDEAVPPADKLRSIWRVLMDSDYPMQTAVLERLHAIETFPVRKFNDRGFHQWDGATSVAGYLCQPLWEGVQRRMGGLTLAQMEQVFDAARERLDAIKGATEKSSD